MPCCILVKKRNNKMKGNAGGTGIKSKKTENNNLRSPGVTPTITEKSMTSSRSSMYHRILLPLCSVQFLNVLKNTLFCSFFVKLLFASQLDFVSVACVSLILALAMGLPALIFFLPAGLFADRVPKRYAIMLSLLADVAVFAVAAFSSAFAAEGTCLTRTFLIFAGLIFTIRAFLTPAFQGILPESFPEEELSRANGTLNFWQFAGLIVGGVAAAFFCSTGVMLMTCLVLSVLSFVISFRIHFTIAVKAKIPFAREFVAGIRDMFRKPSLIAACIGENFFLAIGTILPLLLVLFLLENNSTNPAARVVLLAMPIIGFGVGSYMAGRLSSRKIEPGLVPFGALGVAVMLVLSCYVKAHIFTFNLSVPGLDPVVEISLPVETAVFLFLTGLCGGHFVIPLRAYFQQRLKRETRGVALAGGQVVKFLFAVLLAFCLFYVQAGTLRANAAADLAFFGNGDILSAEGLLTTFGLITFIVTLLTMWALPDFALRFFIISIGSTIYKLHITGAENIPERGPALLLSNHVSFVDNILLCACTSRRIRFLMEEEMMQAHWYLRLLARLTRFITVRSGRKGMMQLFDDVQNALRAGDIICVYPEGLPTRNSVLGEFKSGFRRMIPEDMPDLPVIPVHIGDMWGSRFSYQQTYAKHKLPLRAPHTARITFGEKLPHDVTPFQVRHRITELAADTAINNVRDGEHPLHVQLALNAKRNPFHITTRDVDGKGFSNFKLLLGSVLLSRSLRKMFEQDEEYVGVLMPNCSAAAISLLAVMYADRIPCSLNFTTPKDVLEATLRKANIKHIITSRKFLEKIGMERTDSMILLEEIMPTISTFRKIMYMLFVALTPARELMNIICPKTKDDVNKVATVLFSSGSTGDPKGVMLTHHNMNSDVHAMIDMVSFNPKTDAILGNLPLFHSFGMNVCFWLPLSTGTPISYVISPLDAQLTGKVIQRDKLTFVVATPSFLQTYLRKCTAEQFASARIVVTGAEKLRADITTRFNEFIGGKLVITEGYGATELAPVATINVPKDIMKIGYEFGKKGAIGPALADTAIKVVDPITYQELPPDSEGLMFIRGPMMMKGYLNQPDATEKVMVDGYYNTGDIITMDKSGYITICGRLSRFSKIAGEMVPHEMVECIINELCHMENRVVAVCSIPDPQKGEALLVLYTPETPMTPDEIVAELRERSISNLWIPKAANFHKVDALPMLGTGKLDLTKLRAVAEQVAIERGLKK